MGGFGDFLGVCQFLYEMSRLSLDGTVETYFQSVHSVSILIQRIHEMHDGGG